MQSQYHAPKRRTAGEKSFVSEDSTEPYTISNHNKKVLGGASCRLERGNGGRRDLSRRLVLIDKFTLGPQRPLPHTNPPVSFPGQLEVR